MKKLKLSALLLMIAGLFAGCKDDDKAPRNSFTYGEEEYGLASAEAQYIYNDGDFYYWYLVLTSDGITFDESQSWYTGTGEVVWLTLGNYGEAADELPTGTFVFPEKKKTSSVEVYSFGVNFSFDSPAEEKEYPLAEATVTITKKGSEYIIDFTFMSDSDETVTGHFTGIVKKVVIT